MPTVEQKTSGTILEKPKDVVIGGVTYQVAPPSTATLILVSELVSTLPKLEVELDKNDILSETLRHAKDCNGIGEVVATLIIGAKVIKNWKPNLKGKIKLMISNKSEKSIFYDPLVKSLLEDLSPTALYHLAEELLDRMETGAFFGLTAFLLEINLTKTTREAVTTETIASGQ
jgi:hypothetical protein